MPAENFWWMGWKLIRTLNGNQQVYNEVLRKWEYTDPTVRAKLKETKDVTAKKTWELIDLRDEKRDPNAPVELKDPLWEEEEVSSILSPFDDMEEVVLQEPKPEDIPDGKKLTSLIRFLGWPMYGSQGENMLPHAQNVMQRLRELSNRWENISVEDVLQLIENFNLHVNQKWWQQEIDKRMKLLILYVEWSIRHIKNIDSK